MTIKQNPNKLDLYLGQLDRESKVKKKKCTYCNKIKPIIEFQKKDKIGFKRLSYCKSCQNEYTKRLYHKNKKLNKNKKDNIIFNNEMVRCRGTRLITKRKSHYLPATKKNFYRKNDSKNGLTSMCKECKRINSIERKYNISYYKYEKMYDFQKGKCRICQIHKKILYIDHDHKTGKVRGLLCKDCNAKLGT